MRYDRQRGRFDRDIVGGNILPDVIIDNSVGERGCRAFLQWVVKNNTMYSERSCLSWVHSVKVIFRHCWIDGEHYFLVHPFRSSNSKWQKYKRFYRRRFNSRIGEASNPNEDINIGRYGDLIFKKMGQRCWGCWKTTRWRRWTMEKKTGPDWTRQCIPTGERSIIDLIVVGKGRSKYAEVHVCSANVGTTDHCLNTPNKRDLSRIGAAGNCTDGAQIN